MNVLINLTVVTFVIIIGDRSQGSGCLWGGREGRSSNWNGEQGSFWSAVLLLDLDVSYTAMCLCEKSLSDLRVVLFFIYLILQQTFI